LGGAILFGVKKTILLDYRTFANAVYNATGQRVRDFPITLDKLLVPINGLERATADNI
jgi:hypothetical protein